MSELDRRTLALVVVAGLVISALFWIDPLFLPLALLGPLVAGAVLGWRRAAWPVAVLPWTVAGLGATISDWIVNREDVGFHLVLTVIMSALALVAWWAARALASRRAGTSPEATV